MSTDTVDIGSFVVKDPKMVTGTLGEYYVINDADVAVNPPMGSATPMVNPATPPPQPPQPPQLANPPVVEPTETAPPPVTPQVTTPVTPAPQTQPPAVSPSDSTSPQGNTTGWYYDQGTYAYYGTSDNTYHQGNYQDPYTGQYYDNNYYTNNNYYQTPPAAPIPAPKQPPFPTSSSKQQLEFYRTYATIGSRSPGGIKEETDVGSAGRKNKPKMGWRKIVAATGIPVHKSAKEREWDHMITTLSGKKIDPKIIGFLSLKGGVGTTTTLACTGSVLKKYHLQDVNIVGIDTVPVGSLATRVELEDRKNIKDLVEYLRTETKDGTLRGVSDLEAYLRTNLWKFSCIGSSHTTGQWHLSGYEWELLANALIREYTYLFVDIAPHNNSLDSVLPLINTLDSIVLVTSDREDSLPRANHVLNWLNDLERNDLLNNLSLVVTTMSNTGRFASPHSKEGVALHKKVDSLQNALGVKAIEVPYDLHLDSGGEIDMESVNPRVRTQYIKLAADIAQKLPVYGSRLKTMYEQRMLV